MGGKNMAQIPEDVIEKIRSQVNIVDVVSQYVQLRQSGKNLFGLCPFHEERTPSFSVSEDKQIFHCFSCGRGGNVFKFIMEIENLSFPQAVKKVAELENLPIDQKYFSEGSSGSSSSQNSEQKQLIGLNEEAVSLFNHILLNTKIGEPALKYLRDRGVNDKTISQFKLGYAPNQRLLKQFFDQKKVDYQLLRKSGLFAEDQQGNLHDRFVDRVMFPIRDPNGHTVGFSGRLLGAQENMPKYLNSPETETFNKSKILFNLDFARPNIRKNEPAILFEGFMDVITAFQNGIKTGIASMGTSLTEDQVYDIKRITNQIVVCYDGDTPGQKAIKRAIDIFSPKKGFDVKIVVIPDNLDPDDFIKKRGVQKFEELLSHTQAPLEFELSFLKRNYNLDSEDEQTRYISEALKLISGVGSSLSRDLYLNRLAEEFKVDKDVLKKQIQPLISNQNEVENNLNQGSLSVLPINNVDTSKHLSLVQKAEECLLNRMLNYRDIWLKVSNISGFSFVDEQFQMLYLLAEGYFSKYQDYQIATFSNFISEASLQSLLIEIDMLDLAKDPTDEEINDYLAIIMKKAPVEQQLKEKRLQLREASKIGDEQKVQQLTIDIINLEKQKQQAHLEQA